jgi:hypothetical protein
MPWLALQVGQSEWSVAGYDRYEQDKVHLHRDTDNEKLLET